MHLTTNAPSMSQRLERFTCCLLRLPMMYYKAHMWRCVQLISGRGLMVAADKLTKDWWDLPADAEGLSWLFRARLGSPGGAAEATTSIFIFKPLSFLYLSRSAEEGNKRGERSKVGLDMWLFPGGFSPLDHPVASTAPQQASALINPADN